MNVSVDSARVIAALQQQNADLSLALAVATARAEQAEAHLTQPATQLVSDAD